MAKAKAKTETNGTPALSGGPSQRGFSQNRSSAPNPVQGLWDASVSGWEDGSDTGVVMEIAIGGEAEAKLAENSVRRAAREGDLGYRFQANVSEGWAIFAATVKRERKYTADDVRREFGMDADAEVTSGLRLQYRQIHGLDTVTDVKDWAVGSGRLAESDRIGKDNRADLVAAYREAFSDVNAGQNL